MVSKVKAETLSDVSAYICSAPYTVKVCSGLTKQRCGIQEESLGTS